MREIKTWMYHPQTGCVSAINNTILQGVVAWGNNHELSQGGASMSNRSTMNLFLVTTEKVSPFLAVRSAALTMVDPPGNFALLDFKTRPYKISLTGI